MKNVILITACIIPDEKVKHVNKNTPRIEQYKETINQAITYNADAIILVENSPSLNVDDVKVTLGINNDKITVVKATVTNYTNKGIGEDDLVSTGIDYIKRFLIPNTFNGDEDVLIIKMTGRVGFDNIDFNKFDRNSISIPHNHNIDFINKKYCFPASFKVLSWTFAVPLRYSEHVTNLYDEKSIRRSYEILLYNKLVKSGVTINDFPYFEISREIKIGATGKLYKLYKQGL